MSQALAIILGAVVGGVLAIGGSLIISERQGARQRQHDRNELCRKAYSDLLAAAHTLLYLAQMMHVVMAVRSGLTEGVDILTKVRKPVDPLELWESMRLEVAPLGAAWSEVWTAGSQDGIRLSNKLVDRCAAVVSTATVRGQARSPLMRLLAGEKWTQEQLDAWAAGEKAVAAARRDLALLARREFGIEVAEVFTEVPANDGSA